MAKKKNESAIMTVITDEFQSRLERRQQEGCDSITQAFKTFQIRWREYITYLGMTRKAKPTPARVEDIEALARQMQVLSKRTFLP